MDKSKRKAIIAGNWKMNKTPKEAKRAPQRYYSPRKRCRL